ncbi:CAZyme family GH28 [Penicillium malachiteum]|nr:CAZyme family GH28 [Penicillium malachiteum]
MLAIGTAVALGAPAPSRVSQMVKKSTVCTFNSAASASASKSSCNTIVLDNIEVPAGETLDLTDLNSGTKVIFNGETTFGYEEWDGPMIEISGSSIVVSGTSNHTINGGGERWWDGEGTNGGKTKPKFFYAHSLDDSTITGLNIKNTPVQAFSVESDNLILNSITIDDSDGDANGGHNTDGFDVGESTGVTISNAVVMNQDDCLAVNSGTDSENGIRIKTNSGATGSVSGVTFSNIQISGITDYGIVFEQDYENGDPTGTPTDGVSITDLTVESVTGTVESDATDVYILCASGACSDWTWSDVSVTGGSTSDECENVPSGASC